MYFSDLGFPLFFFFFVTSDPPRLAPPNVSFSCFFQLFNFERKVVLLSNCMRSSLLSLFSSSSRAIVFGPSGAFCLLKTNLSDISRENWRFSKNERKKRERERERERERVRETEKREDGKQPSSFA